MNEAAFAQNCSVNICLVAQMLFEIKLKESLSL